MFKYENSVHGKTNINKVWRLYSDVSKWYLWDNSVKFVQLAGTFESGSKGSMEMADGSTMPFTLIECSNNKSFTTQSKLGSITVTFGHFLRETSDEIAITHTVEINGGDEKQMEGMGKGITKGIPDCMNQLISIAKNDEIV